MEKETALSSPREAGEITAAQEPTITHEERPRVNSQWTKMGKVEDGDTAMALFDDADQLHEPVDPEEERMLLRKIDFMVLPYLAVCYAFFYIDKVWQHLVFPLSLKVECGWSH
jgi:hypothetical protein